MSFYAFEDIKRELKVDANQNLSKQKRFYCPNKNCDAHLFLCNQDGVSKAYFRATLRAHLHTNGCPFENSNSGDIENLDEKSFRIDDFFDNLFLAKQSKKSNTKTPNNSQPLKNQLIQIKTIRHLYSLCKIKNIDSQIAENNVWQLLLDDRSKKNYTKLVPGKRLIEAKFNHYNKDNQEIFLKLYNFLFILSFENKNLFFQILGNIFANKKTYIVVAGNWEINDDKFHAPIISKKQIWLV
jgi:hypothetical protein